MSPYSGIQANPTQLGQLEEKGGSCVVVFQSLKLRITMLACLACAYDVMRGNVALHSTGLPAMPLHGLLIILNVNSDQAR